MGLATHQMVRYHLKPIAAGLGHCRKLK